MLFPVVEVTPTQMINEVTLWCPLMLQLLVFHCEFQEGGHSMCNTGY